MFKHCRLTITQGDKWLNVMLLPPWQTLRFISKLAIYQGYWKLGESSASTLIDDHYAFGSFNPMHGDTEGKFWTYYPGNLVFREFSTDTTGRIEVDDALILNNAFWTDSQGVAPIGGSGTARIVMAAQRFFTLGMATWEHVGNWQF